MKRDPYLEKYVELLEQTASRAQKDLERERKRVDFLEGKAERLELVVMGYKNDAGVEYVARTDEAAQPAKRPKPPITQVPVAQGRIPFSQVRAQWDSMTEKEQEAAIENQDLKVG